MGEVIPGNFPQAEPESEYVTVPEFARITRTSERNLYRLIAKGELPALRIGRSLRIPRMATRIDNRNPWARPIDDYHVNVDGA